MMPPSPTPSVTPPNAKPSHGIWGSGKSSGRSSGKRRLRAEYEDRLSGAYAQRKTPPVPLPPFDTQWSSSNDGNAMAVDEVVSVPSYLPPGSANRASREGMDIYSDRYIPSRSESQLELGYPVLSGEGQRSQNENDDCAGAGECDENAATRLNGRIGSPSAPGGLQDTNAILNGLLSKQLLGERAERSSGEVLRFKKLRQSEGEDVRRNLMMAPRSDGSWRMAAATSAPGCVMRKVPKAPFRVLDAPNLTDDFYLNLMDWSAQNLLAVALGGCVYLWSACTAKVTKLCEQEPGKMITSLCWTQRGAHLGVGVSDGDVQIWDVNRCRKVRSMPGHDKRVSAMSWSQHLLATGGRDTNILLRDVRSASPWTHRLRGHKQEICGLKWSFDGQQLASGGNDNKLMLWNAHSTSPLIQFHQHTAAVKAIAWSPHQAGLLASGGGSQDRCIRFWNTVTQSPLHFFDAGSQVCNLMWSQNVNELISTHGYSLNQIIIWRYPSMAKVATLTGHTYRVLYMAMSPDGQTVVTGAGDETLRFWNAFPGAKQKNGGRNSTSYQFKAGGEVR